MEGEVVVVDDRAEENRSVKASSLVEVNLEDDFEVKVRSY